jgi:hypothetical protein
MVSPGIILCRGAAPQTIGGVLSVVSRKDPVVPESAFASLWHPCFDYSFSCRYCRWFSIVRNT